MGHLPPGDRLTGPLLPPSVCHLGRPPTAAGHFGSVLRRPYET
ncbi:hypothetical protein [Streptomyces sp. NPDC052727]